MAESMMHGRTILLTGALGTLGRAQPAVFALARAVAPDAVVSEAEERVFGDKLQKYNDWILENQSLRQRIQPEDVAWLVLFLAGRESDLITGQNFGIDGGW